MIKLKDVSQEKQLDLLILKFNKINKILTIKKEYISVNKSRSKTRIRKL
jgi:hypothetical protein